MEFAVSRQGRFLTTSRISFFGVCDERERSPIARGKPVKRPLLPRRDPRFVLQWPMGWQGVILRFLDECIDPVARYGRRLDVFLTEKTMNTTVGIVERHDLHPICPHCSKEVETLLLKNLQSSLFSKRCIYFCPHCRKVLGVSHRKGLLIN